MGFLGNFFGGGGVSIEGLRKAIAQQRYVDARQFAEQLAEQPLNEVDAAEVEKFRISAGDGLARLNLNEALGLQCNGDFVQAAEHLSLAQEQVCSAELRGEIDLAIAAEPLEPEIDATAADQLNPSGHAITLLDDEDTMSGDAESQLELILISYPPDLATRYGAKNETFKEAFLLSHAGQDEQALPFWQRVDVADQDDLYWFELGALFARNGNYKEARSTLEKALEQNSELLLAGEALISVLLATGDYQVAKERLKKFLDQGIDASFCHAQLTSLYVQQQEYSTAAEHARQAFAAGNNDSRFMLLAASVLEHVGSLDEAETILKMFPVSSGKGVTSLPLAEFWLRHNRELGNILDTFNAACRDEPENPRWQLRAAQTYLARNWVKDGLKLLRKVVNDPRLEPELAQEAKQLLTDHHG